MSAVGTGLLLGILTNILGGSSYVLQKLALDDWPPATLIFLRVAISLPFFYALTPKGAFERATRADWIRMIVVGSLGFAAPNLVGIYAIEKTESMNAALLIGLEPVTIVVLSALFLREPLRPAQIAGFVLALAGAAVVVARGQPSALLEFQGEARANLGLALHAMLWAIYTVLGKPTLERVPPTAFCLVTSGVGLACVLPFFLGEVDRWSWARLSDPRAMGYVLGMALGISVLAVVLWNIALAKLKASEMAVLVFIQPVASALLSLLIGETLGPIALVGGALVLGGVALSELSATPRRSDAS